MISGVNNHNNAAMTGSVTDPYALPEDLPVPSDDGACNHLCGLKFPKIRLPSTMGDIIDPSTLDGIVVIYCYPRTGKPGVALPDGWDSIPGARGCTPQACTFRDLNAEFNACGERSYLV